VTDTQIGATLLTGLLSGLAAESWIAGVAVTIATAVLIVGTERGWFVAAAPVVWRVWVWIRGLFARKHEADEGELYDLVLGHDPATGLPDMENLTELGHFGVYGVTRFGKTTWIHSILYQLIADCRPRELRLCISDPKQTDYAFFGRLPHLLCPIARDACETEQVIDRLIGEMNRRIELFKPYAETAVCNNIYRYQELSGDSLPWVLAVFDELTDVVQAGTDSEKKLIRLAKLGLGYGIQLLCGTQRPSAAVMTGELQSNISSIFSTWMKSAREYGVVAQIPKEIYQDMQRKKGRFIVYTPKGWRFLQGRIVGDRELARRAKALSGRARRWEDERETAVTVPEPVPWAQLTEDEKLTRVHDWLQGLDYEPTLTEYQERFGFSRPVAVRMRQALTGQE
jgi:hypothetical protein